MATLFYSTPVYTQHSSIFSNVGDIAFNSDWLKCRWKQVGSSEEKAAIADVRRKNTATSPVFEDPYSVIEHVLVNCGDLEVVLPSERYFYYKFRLDHRLVSGNLRFADVEKGIVHVGYFNAHDRTEMRIGKIVDGENGTVSLDGTVATVVFRGLTRRFTLDKSWHETHSEAPKLIGDEKLVTGVLDESGFYFWLIYSKATRRMYYVLNESAPKPEMLVDFPSKLLKIKMGFESRFVFLFDEPTERWILTGVAVDNISANNYFDGPFDQVPPDLEIKGILEHVYPYCKYRGGIDNHGNFNTLEGQRMAISPYQKFTSLGQHVSFLEENYKRDSIAESLPTRWEKIVYESKMDFHKELLRSKTENQSPSKFGKLTAHDQQLSRAWPANHYRKNSDNWPREHVQRTSMNWGANRISSPPKNNEKTFSSKLKVKDLNPKPE